MKRKVTIIDAKFGNLASVSNAFAELGATPFIAKKRKDISNAERVVLPGVGNFGLAMQNLRENELDFTIKEFVKSGKPVLGICLGMQILFEKSEESPGEKGLGVLAGEVKFLNGPKNPQIGWNRIKQTKECRLLKEIRDNSFVFFANSYCAKPNAAVIAAKSKYGKEFCAAVEEDNVFGTQFHPEKSSEIGLKILKNFLEVK